MTLRHGILVDGDATDCLPPDDRGLLYGDGVFRTLRVIAGEPRWWDEQLAKLADDCRRIGLEPHAASIWRGDFERLSVARADGVLKLLVTRGSGPRGYLPPEQPVARRLMYFVADSLPADIAPDITLRICSLRLGWQPRLAGIKHLNRLENVLARAEWTSPDIHEGLLLDQADRVVGGVMSNLFIWQRNRLLTPRLDQCGVAGVARARLMRLAQAHAIEVQETDLALRDVLDADEVMLTNSVMGLRRVARLEAKVWPDPVISPRLVEWLNA
jgi:4-amino-4-deoxychorismate lyase